MSTRVCALDDLEPNSSTRFDIDGHRLSVVRFEGEEIFIIGDKCTHADFSLSDGELDVEERTLECPKHGSSFSLETGDPDCLPATKSVPTYEASVLDGEIMVKLS